MGALYLSINAIGALVHLWMYAVGFCVFSVIDVVPFSVRLCKVCCTCLLILYYEKYFMYLTTLFDRITDRTVEWEYLVSIDSLRIMVLLLSYDKVT